jgi:hypothetical protein
MVSKTIATRNHETLSVLHHMPALNRQSSALAGTERGKTSEVDGRARLVHRESTWHPSPRAVTASGVQVPGRAVITSSLTFD